MAENEIQRWQSLFLHALQNPLGSSDLLERVREAETEIFQRIQQLRASPNANDERLALAEALNSLRYMRIENFKHASGYSSDQAAAE
jgi:hypothetical protein